MNKLDLLTPQDSYSVLLPPVLPTGQSDGRFTNRSPRFNPRFIKSAGTAMANISKTPILNSPPKLFCVFSRDIFIITIYTLRESDALKNNYLDFYLFLKHTISELFIRQSPCQNLHTPEFFWNPSKKVIFVPEFVVLCKNPLFYEVKMFLKISHAHLGPFSPSLLRQEF